MEVWEAVVLGLVQGLTEFLPVSSSGHLQIFNTLFGLQGEENLTFAVAVHAAVSPSTTSISTSTWSFTITWPAVSF